MSKKYAPFIARTLEHRSFDLAIPEKPCQVTHTQQGEKSLVLAAQSYRKRAELELDALCGLEAIL